MKFSIKILIFAVAFTLVFYWIHASGQYNTRVVLADLGGLPGLYQSLVMLFSILSGFVIQKEWENWNSLVDSVKAEVDSLGEFWLWSLHLSEKYKDRFIAGIKYYLQEMSQDGLNKTERGEHSDAIEKSFNEIQDAMFEMSQSDSHLMPTTFSFFGKIIEARTSRIRYSLHHIPQTLHRTLLFSTMLVIVLCLFIGIKDIWLDYSFTMAIALSAYVIYIVIDDLDHPLVPGNWHLTTRDYERLLKRIEKAERE